MRQKRSSNNYSRLKYYFFGLLLCALAFAGLYIADQYFTVKDIKIISPQERLSVKGLENLAGENTILLSEENIRETVIRNNPLLRNIKVEKVYPDQLVVSVELEKSVAALKVNQGFFILNQNGKIISKEKVVKNNLPQINYYQQLNYNTYEAGDRVDLKEIAVSLHFLQKARGTGLSVLSIDIGGVDMIRLNLNKQQTLIFSTEKDLELQDYQFERIIRQFKIEGQEFSALDFRFDKPIIKLK